jgi:hypothetical protein
MQFHLRKKNTRLARTVLKARTVQKPCKASRLNTREIRKAEVDLPNPNRSGVMTGAIRNPSFRRGRIWPRDGNGEILRLAAAYGTWRRCSA